MPEIRQITMQDPFYKQEQELRNRVLLRPIGMPDHAWEMNDAKAFHFIAMEDETVVGCALLLPVNETSYRLMQMAVETNQQGKGIGGLLIYALKRFAKSTTAREIMCHARENAVHFYRQQGFEIYGDPFMEVGIQHRYMRTEV